MKSFSDYIIIKSAIRHNLRQCKRVLNGTKICAVVKANGYGVGIKNVVKQIDDLVDYYAVACFVEAKKLRQITQKPILVLNFVHMSTFDYCIKNNISITVSNLKQQKIIEQFEKRFLNKKHKLKNILESQVNEKKIKIHFAINTGMNRIGFSSQNDFYKSLVILKKCKYLKLEGIYTHFYNAENLKDTTNQNRIFMQYLDILKTNINQRNLIVHAANSEAALNYKIFNYDMIRLGIVLYGGLEINYDPVQYGKSKGHREYKTKFMFKPSISIKSKIIAINNVKKGECVGYCKNYIAKKNMVVATIPLGYADGIFRNFSKKGKVLINGKKCKVVGNICMDMFMVDITNVKAKIFDEVILIGKDKLGNTITLNEFASYCDTISYEVLTNIKQMRFNIKTA